MLNVAGKSYAMTVVTPHPTWLVWAKKLIFWALGTRFLGGKLSGLITLSLIHYARWVIVKPNQFPRLSPDQPPEELHYSYMLFFSNFNGSWLQYVDSFSSTIPSGLDWLWKWSVGYPLSVPMHPFHAYITANQIWTDHYFNAYPMASSNDVKSAKRVRTELLAFMNGAMSLPPDDFQKHYDQLLLELQHDLSQMGPSPVVSLSARAVELRHPQGS